MTEPTPVPNEPGEGFRTTTAPDNRAYVNYARGNAAFGIPTPNTRTMDDQPFSPARTQDATTSTQNGHARNGTSRTPAHKSNNPTDPAGPANSPPNGTSTTNAENGATINGAVADQDPKDAAGPANALRNGTRTTDTENGTTSSGADDPKTDGSASSLRERTHAADAGNDTSLNGVGSGHDLEHADGAASVLRDRTRATVTEGGTAISRAHGHDLEHDDGAASVLPDGAHATDTGSGTESSGAQPGHDPEDAAGSANAPHNGHLAGRNGVANGAAHNGTSAGDAGSDGAGSSVNGVRSALKSTNGVLGGDVAGTFVGRAGYVLGDGAAAVTNGRGVSFGVGETAGVLPGDQRTFDDVEAGIVALWRKFGERREQRLRDRLVLHYAPLVKYVAGRVGTGLPAHVEVADLIQSGIFGLVDAIEKFEPERGLKFETYAMQRIRGAILDDLRAQDWVPRSVRGRAREVERALERLGAKLRRTPTDAELADELGLSLHELREVYAQLQLTSVVALDELAAAGRGSTPLADILEDQEALDPVALLVDQDNRRQLAQAIAHLAERDRVVVTLYYFENLTLAEIGRVLGVTESRVCQLHTRAVLRLRAKLLERPES